MATDYDAPRRRPGEDDEDEGVLLAPPKPNAVAAAADLGDDVSALETMDLPGAELVDDQLEITVVPKQADEFTCKACWMVMHRSQRSAPSSDTCRDCA